MPQDAYSKFFRFKAVSPSTLTELAKDGYGEITLAMDSGDVVITSTGEFLSTCFLKINNKDISGKWIDASTIKFYPYANWGTFVAEIVEK